MRLLFALLLVFVTAAPAQAAQGCDGVTVVVDFRGLGGGVQTGCAPGAPSSGLAALTSAGFGYTSASRQPGFVCRINGKPAGDPCVNASPTTAYWSYWHGQPGGSWTYSSAGAGGYTPPPGSVEGWAFGAGEQPGIAPPAAAPKPPPPPPPAPPQPQQPVPPPVKPTTSMSEPTSISPAVTSSPVPSESSSVVSPATSASTSDTPRAVEPTASSSSGGWLLPVLVVLVIAVLGGLGFWTARRRSAE